MNNKFLAYGRRVLFMLPAIPVMAFGVCLTVLGNLGSDPFTSFQMGISNQTGIAVGTASLLCNVIILVAFIFINRKLINIASVICAFGIGPCINLFNGLIWKVVPMESLGMAGRVFSVILGTFLIILSVSWYIPTDVGVQPLDMLAITVGGLFKKSYGFGLNVVYAFMFVAAIIMGSPWGFGTIVATLCVGKGVDILMPKLRPVVQKICNIQQA